MFTFFCNRIYRSSIYLACKNFPNQIASNLKNGYGHLHELFARYYMSSLTSDMFARYQNFRYQYVSGYMYLILVIVRFRMKIESHGEWCFQSTRRLPCGLTRSGLLFVQCFYLKNIFLFDFYRYLFIFYQFTTCTRLKHLIVYIQIDITLIFIQKLDFPFKCFAMHFVKKLLQYTQYTLSQQSIQFICTINI